MVHILVKSFSVRFIELTQFRRRENIVRKKTLFKSSGSDHVVLLIWVEWQSWESIVHNFVMSRDVVCVDLSLLRPAWHFGTFSLILVYLGIELGSLGPLRLIYNGHRGLWLHITFYWLSHPRPWHFINQTFIVVRALPLILIIHSLFELWKSRIL